MITCRVLSHLLRSTQSCGLSNSTLRRLQSAWLNKAQADASLSAASGTNLEKLFTDENVQKLLSELTGMDLDNKVFRARKTAIQQREHYALMTDERLEKTMDRMKDEAKKFLQPVPFKEPRPDRFEILSKDEEISGFDDSRFVFTDITFDATDQDRAVVVREVDGTLRTATPEEHDRMNRVYYEKENRPVEKPKLFSDPWLQNALDRGEHEFVMDWACWFFEPDDPEFVKLSRLVFDRTAESRRFDCLHSTRHFSTLAFYLALNGNIPPLLNWFGVKGRVEDAARLIRLQKTLHPDWRVAVSKEDSDRKIVEDFIRQNERLKLKMPDLISFLWGEGRSEGRKETPSSSSKRTTRAKMSTTVNASTVGSTAGPLGSMASEYTVHLKKGEEREKPQSTAVKDKRRRGERPRGKTNSEKNPTDE